MSALRIFATGNPSLVGAPVQPMTAEDAQFWRLWHQRKPTDKEITR